MAARWLLAVLALGSAVLGSMWGPRAAQGFTLTGQITGGDALLEGGEFLKLEPPFETPEGGFNTVGNDTQQTYDLFAFDEDQNIFLTNDLQVDLGTTIPGGTTVASHYLFFDPAVPATISGTVTFDSEILGVITSTDTLFASDFLANTGVTYLNPVSRGLESGDSLAITADNELTFTLTANTPGDYVRIITAFSPTAEEEANSVPEPAGIVGITVAGLALVGRRCRARQE